MRPLAAVLLSGLLVLAASTGNRARTVDTAEFGPVQVQVPGNGAKAFAIAFSGADGFTGPDRQAMQALGEAGFAVALIDSGRALRHLSAPGGSRACIDLAGPLEWLSSTVERDLGWDRYRPPLVVGHGVGGTLAYAALAQSPQAFAGGISVDLQQELALRTQVCRLSTQRRSGGRLQLSWKTPPGARWLVGSTTAHAPPAKAFVAVMRGGPDASPPAILAPGPIADIYRRAAPAFLTLSTQSSPTSIADLPLVEVSSTTAVDTLAVIYSGDGGWRDIDKQLGDALATRGIAVVGVDSLRYFWSPQTAEQVSADLALILAHYTAAWHIRHVVLIGYSFGADILPFAYNRLSADLQERVSQITLLAPGRAAVFEIQTLGWFGAGPSDDARPIPPEAARIEHAKVQCVFGIDDAGDSLCTQASARGMEVVRRPGGHHFNNDYVALARIVLKGICRRGVACRA